MAHFIRRESQTGFTVVELLVVLSILAVALALVAPTLSGVFAGARGDGAVKQLITALRETRAMAITADREVAFALSSDGRSWRRDGGGGAIGGLARLAEGSVGARIVFFADGWSS